MCISRIFLSLAFIAVCLMAWAENDSGNQVCAGDYTVSLTNAGLVITHKGAIISFGSALTVFSPGYKGRLVSIEDAQREGYISISRGGRTLTLEAGLPQGNLIYSATVSESGVSVTARVTMKEGVSIGPVECSWFQFAPELVKGGSIDVQNKEGILIGTASVTDAPGCGGISRPGDVLIVKSSSRKIIISTDSHFQVYPFDARLEKYGNQRGIWAFGSMPVKPGSECVVSIELAIKPSESRLPEGNILIVPDRSVAKSFVCNWRSALKNLISNHNTEITSVALAPKASERERLAAEDIVSYLARISGKKLEIMEVSDKTVPMGVIVVGRLAIETGLINQQELNDVQRDGYVIKVAQGRVAICGWRDLGTVYGAYAFLSQLGVRFYASDCEVVPRFGNLRIKEQRLCVKPFYEFRWVRPWSLKLGHTPLDDCVSPTKLVAPQGVNQGDGFHAQQSLVPCQEYGEKHPEYFALQKDGKRLNPKFHTHEVISKLALKPHPARWAPLQRRGPYGLVSNSLQSPPPEGWRKPGWV